MGAQNIIHTTPDHPPHGGFTGSSSLRELCFANECLPEVRRVTKRLGSRAAGVALPARPGRTGLTGGSYVTRHERASEMGPFSRVAGAELSRVGVRLLR